MMETISPESPAVQAHLRMTQDIIRRMAESSRHCKTWCIAVSLGVLLASALPETPWCAPIALAPVLPLMLLDAYYLALERAFREQHRMFIGKLHQEELTPDSLFDPGPSRSIHRNTLRALTSFSVYGLYGPLALTVGLASWMLKSQ